MNPEELLNLAEAAMLQCQDRHQYRYHLSIRKGRLWCFPASTAQPDDILITVLTRYQLEHGLLTDEWNTVSQKLSTVFQELIL